MEYLIKSSAIIVLFYFIYKALLQRDTFFESNRWFFIGGIVLALIIPLIIIPVYITVEPQQTTIGLTENTTLKTIVNQEAPFNWVQFLSIVYLLGLIIFGIKLCVQLFSLATVLYRNNKFRFGKYIYVKVSDNISPFSFFNWIVYNPNQFKEEELEQIITHEKVHAKQYHSIDMLLIQIATVVFWFNPFIWLYKKSIEQNLEFIADSETQKISECEKSYQQLLLKTSVPNYQMAFTNNFYNSLIKKRIVMLHKSKSNKKNQLKHLLIIPILALFLMSFNTKKVFITKTIPVVENSNLNDSKDLILEEVKAKPILLKTPNKTYKSDNKKSNKVIAKDKGDVEMVIITKDMSDDDLDNLKTKLKAKGITLKIKGLKRNKNNEITDISISAKSKKSQASMNESNNSGINPIKIAINENSISIGNTSHLHGDNYYFTTKDGKTKIHETKKGNNVFVYSSSDNHEDNEVIELKGSSKIKSNGKTVVEIKDEDGNITIHETTKGTNGVFVHSDGNKVIELKGNATITDDNGNVLIKSTGKNKLWTKDNDTTVVVDILGKNDNKLFISSKSGDEPLFIVDGKEIAKKDLDLEPNNIESVSVLKGEAATKKYGKKGKNGVVIIITKE